MILACLFRGGKGGVSSKDAHGDPDADAGDGKNLPIVDCLFPGVGNKLLGTNGDSTHGPDANDSEEATPAHWHRCHAFLRCCLLHPEPSHVENLR